MSGIEIEQDYEVDDDGVVNGRLSCWWTEGHGHDETEFAVAVAQHCFDNGFQAPAIDLDDIREMWQRNIPVGDSVLYRRSMEPPKGPRDEAFPVTVLDIEARRGGRKCAVHDCMNPWAMSRPVQVADKVDGDYMAVDITLCREHSQRFPEPSYRVRFVPVGATIMLPTADEAES